MTDLPIRPGFWNVPLWGEIAVYVLGLAAVLVLIAGVIRNRKLWLQGAQDPRPVTNKKARWIEVIKGIPSLSPMKRQLLERQEVGVI